MIKFQPQEELLSLIYSKPPSHDITIEEFSNLCIARVRFLRQIDQLYIHLYKISKNKIIYKYN